MHPAMLHSRYPILPPATRLDALMLHSISADHFDSGAIRAPNSVLPRPESRCHGERPAGGHRALWPAEKMRVCGAYRTRTGFVTIGRPSPRYRCVGWWRHFFPRPLPVRSCSWPHHPLCHADDGARHNSQLRAGSLHLLSVEDRWESRYAGLRVAQSLQEAGDDDVEFAHALMTECCRILEVTCC